MHKCSGVNAGPDMVVQSRGVAHKRTSGAFQAAPRSPMARRPTSRRDFVCDVTGLLEPTNGELIERVISCWALRRILRLEKPKKGSHCPSSLLT